MKDIIRTCNSTVTFSKFTLNIKINEEFEGFFGEKLCSFFVRTSHILSSETSAY